MKPPGTSATARGDPVGLFLPVAPHGPPLPVRGPPARCGPAPPVGPPRGACAFAKGLTAPAPFRRPTRAARGFLCPFPYGPPPLAPPRHAWNLARRPTRRRVGPWITAPPRRGRRPAEPPPRLGHFRMIGKRLTFCSKERRANDDKKGQDWFDNKIIRWILKLRTDDSLRGPRKSDDFSKSNREKRFPRRNLRIFA